MDGGGSNDSESGRNGDTPMTHELQRRQFLSQTSLSLGSAALSTLLNGPASTALADDAAGPGIGLLAARAKSIIYLFMHGGPSQLDLFDHKPGLREQHGQELPDSVRGDQRLSFIRAVGEATNVLSHEQHLALIGTMSVKK